MIRMLSLCAKGCRFESCSGCYTIQFDVMSKFSFLDGDEPLLSGSGMVSKDVTDEVLLETWQEVITRWHQDVSKRPKNVASLVRKGVPEALRGEVWQLLAKATNDKELLEAYRILISKVNCMKYV